MGSTRHLSDASDHERSGGPSALDEVDPEECRSTGAAR